MSSNNNGPKRLLIVLPDVGQSASKLRGLVSFLEDSLDPGKKGRTKIIVYNAPYRKISALRGAKERAWCDVEDIQKLRNYSVLTKGMKKDLKESVKNIHEEIKKEISKFGVKQKYVSLLGLGQGGVVSVLAGMSYKGGLCNISCIGTEGFPMKELVLKEADSKSTSGAIATADSAIAHATKDNHKSYIGIVNTKSTESFAVEFRKYFERNGISHRHVRTIIASEVEGNDLLQEALFKNKDEFSDMGRQNCYSFWVRTAFSRIK